MLINNVVLVIYIKYFLKELSPAFFFPNRHSFMGIPIYLKLAISSMCIYCLEWWAIELITIISSQISLYQLGAQVIVAEVYWFYTSFGFGLSYASEICVGRCIGANNVKEAKEFRKLIMQIGISISAIAMVSFFFLRFFISELFTPIYEIQQVILNISPLLSICLFFEMTQAWSQGFLRGLGVYNHALATVLISFYCLTIPLAYYLGIVKGMELFGIWLALATGQFTVCSMYMYLSHFFYDWK